MDTLTEYAERMWLGGATMRGLFADGAPMGVAAPVEQTLALIAELALAAPDDAAVHQVRAEVNEARAGAEPSLMARGLFRWAARESRQASAAHS